MDLANIISKLRILVKRSREDFLCYIPATANKQQTKNMLIVISVLLGYDFLPTCTIQLP